MAPSTPIRALATLLVVLTTGVALSSTAGTVHYRWLDEKGYPVHSDRPPPKGVDYEVISTGSGLKRIVDSEEGAVPAEINPRVGNEFTQVDSNEANRSKKNPELCQRARDNLQTLTGDTRVRVRNSQGEIRYLTEEEVIVEREKAKAQINVYCD